MGVPAERATVVLKLIIDGAAAVGFFKDIRGKRYVTLDGVELPTSKKTRTEEAEGEEQESLSADVAPSSSTQSALALSAGNQISSAFRRVYVTHGKNRTFIEPVKKLLSFGELEPVVSVERPSVSQPLPEKIMGEMRSCGAAIIHVDAELKLLDADANEHIVLNPNVLMEIGAAMALFGRRFILLVRDGVKLPSNLQGLFEVRYSGDILDGDATVRLLEAIRDIKNHPMPERYTA